MKLTKLSFVLAFAAMTFGVTAQTASVQTNTVTQQTNKVADLEDEIRYQELIVEGKQDTIKDLESRIKVLKERVDSLNKVEKEVKNQISALEKEKKGQENGIKLANKTRQAAFSDRDNLVYQLEVQPVFNEAFNKLDVENAMKAFDGMETKDVIKKQDLLKNYGKYYKDIREFLEKQKSTFEQLNWATQGADSEVMKKFQSAFKKLSYYKIFEKGEKDPKNASIAYLDDVMHQIQQLQRSGFNSQYQYDRVIDMLYK